MIKNAVPWTLGIRRYFRGQAPMYVYHIRGKQALLWPICLPLQYPVMGCLGYRVCISQFGLP